MIGEPKINLDALKARLRGAVDQSLAKADAQVRAEVVHPVLPATEKKSKPRNDENGKNGKRELSEGELVRLKKQGEEYIKTTQEAIAGARDMTELMELVKEVSSTKKEGKMRLSLKLPNGLPALLPKDSDFSGKFNVLLDRWGERVTAILFDDADGIPRFKAFMKGVILDSPNMSRAKFFDMYLERSSLSKLGGVSNVIKKMKEMWDQYLPEVKVKEKEALKKEKVTMHKEEQKSPEDTFSALVKALGKRLDPFKNDDTEVLIESVSPEEIVLKYRNNTGGQWIPGKIRVAQAIGFAKDLQKNFGFELRKRKPSKKEKDKVKTADNGDQVIKDQPDAPTSTRVGDPADQPPLPDGVSPEPVVGTVAGSAKEGAETPIRTYEELFKEADADGYHDILFGAAVAGINTMKEGAQKESVDLKTYNIDHPGEILGALIDGMKDSFARVGGKFGWSESETDMYARELVGKSIEKYLK